MSISQDLLFLMGAAVGLVFIYCVLRRFLVHKEIIANAEAMKKISIPMKLDTARKPVGEERWKVTTKIVEEKKRERRKRRRNRTPAEIAADKARPRRKYTKTSARWTK